MNFPEYFAFTQSNLQDYLDCAYRFYLRYILRIKWPALQVDDAIDFELRGQTGARFHRLIQQYLLGVPEARLGNLAAADPDANVSRWWTDFLTCVPPQLDGVPYVETSLITRIEQQVVLAKYDLILVQDKSRYTIFDWKTNQKQPRKDWLLDRTQTRLYRFLLTQSGSDLSQHDPIDAGQVTMNYWFATHPETLVSLPYSQEAFEVDKTYFSNLITEISGREPDDFTRTSDLQKCRFCVYRSHCDRGVTAGDLADFDLFTTEPEEFQWDPDFDAIQEINF